MDESTYNEQTCFTVEQLRAMKFTLPEDLPDLAWIPRSALKLTKVGSVVIEGVERNRFKVEWLKPFRYYQVVFEIDRGKDNGN